MTLREYTMFFAVLWTRHEMNAVRAPIEIAIARMTAKRSTTIGVVRISKPTMKSRLIVLMLKMGLAKKMMRLAVKIPMKMLMRF